ncbi:MAG: HDIG domain-containing protein, partial [Deltaproteobacteria bacterium]|nr:HDIG domain-containing protein [Deltaproteobacteria bacterium]
MFEACIHEAGGEIYEVGGTVRDRILGLSHKDRDFLVTGIPIDKLSEILKTFGVVTFVGKSFGVLKFSPFKEKGVTYDIAIPRKEVSTGSGHRDFEVSYDHALPVEIDLSRRDFTINAMAKNIRTGEIIDPFGGREDLKKLLLKQVFDGAFREDPLRLLRAVQFAARFNLSIEPETHANMKKFASLIETISGERVAEELKKLFSAQKPSIGFDIMNETGLLKHIFPEVAATVGIEQDKGHDVFRHTMIVLDATASDKLIDYKGDLELMFAALLHDVGKTKTARFVPEQKRIAFFGHQIVSKRIAAKRMAQLKITTLGVQPENVLTLIENHMFETKSFYTDKAIRRFVAKVGKDLIMKLVDFRIADNRGGKYPASAGGVLKLKKRINEELSRKPPFGPKDLAVNGHDLMEIGFSAGPKMGDAIKQLVELVLDDPGLNAKEQLLAISKNLLKGAS